MFQLTLYFSQFANSLFLYIQQGFMFFFTLKILKSEISSSDCQVLLWCPWGKQLSKISSSDLQRWSCLSLLGCPQGNQQQIFLVQIHG